MMSVVNFPGSQSLLFSDPVSSLPTTHKTISIEAATSLPFGSFAASRIARKMALRSVFQKFSLGAEAFVDGTLWTMVAADLPDVYASEPASPLRFSGSSPVAGEVIPDADIIGAMAWLWDTGALDAATVNKTYGYSGETLLFLAIFHRRQAVAEWLLAHGADPRISPELWLSGEHYRPYLSSSILAMALYRGMTPDFITALLKAGVNVYHWNEYTHNSMFDLVVFHLNFLSPQTRIQYLRILLDHGAEVNFSAMNYLIESYNYGDHLFAGVDLQPLIGDVVWRYYGPEKCAINIQRTWREYRRVKACKKIQSIVRSIILHPDHVWGDGLSTFQHFAQKDVVTA